MLLKSEKEQRFKNDFGLLCAICILYQIKKWGFRYLSNGSRLGAMKKELINKFDEKSAKIGIVGLGYVGLPLLLRFAEENFEVLGFDIDATKIEKLAAGKSYIKHIPDSEVAKVIENCASATTDFSRVSEVDVIVICVPTPLTKNRDPDMSFIISTMNSLSPHLRKGQLISLESTTYPGTTDELLAPYLYERGFTLGDDIFLVYSPEREDPGNKNFSTRTIPKVCGGYTESCLEVGYQLYSQVIDKVLRVSSTKTAEMTKLLENIHRAVNIGLVNEMKIVADKMGIDIHEVVQAASSKPFGFTPYYPGPGLGGHCIPIDPFYLTWKAKEFDISTKFIELSGEINSSMPKYVVSKITDALNERQKPLKGSKVLVLGIAYKKNVDDMRESPAVEIMEQLREKGAVVAYSDPFVPKFPKMREYHFELESVVLDREVIQQQDCLLIATDHDDFPYQDLIENAPLLVDTRGRFLTPRENLVKA